MASDPWYRRMAEDYRNRPDEEAEERRARLLAATPFEVHLWKGAYGFYAGLSVEVDPGQDWHTSGQAVDIDDAVREAIALYGESNISRFVYVYIPPGTPISASAASQILDYVQSMERD